MGHSTCLRWPLMGHLSFLCWPIVVDDHYSLLTHAEAGGWRSADAYELVPTASRGQKDSRRRVPGSSCFDAGGHQRHKAISQQSSSSHYAESVLAKDKVLHDNISNRMNACRTDVQILKSSILGIHKCNIILVHICFQIHFLWLIFLLYCKFVFQVPGPSSTSAGGLCFSPNSAKGALHWKSVRRLQTFTPIPNNEP